MEIKQIKYIGEQTLSYVIGKCKATFALITHTHTSEEIGADAAGSAASALGLANEYTNEKVAEITSGDTVVKESEHSSTADTATNAEHAVNAEHATSADTATTADSATKATQDGNGNVITDVYETKTDANEKLTEAKTHTDTLSEQVAYINEEDNENIANPDVSASEITVDSALSETSTNPVQNKVVTAKLKELEGNCGGGSSGGEDNFIKILLIDIYRNDEETMLEWYIDNVYQGENINAKTIYDYYIKGYKIEVLYNGLYLIKNTILKNEYDGNVDYEVSFKSLLTDTGSYTSAPIKISFNNEDFNIDEIEVQGIRLMSGEGQIYLLKIENGEIKLFPQNY